MTRGVRRIASATRGGVLVTGLLLIASGIAVAQVPPRAIEPPARVPAIPPDKVRGPLLEDAVSVVSIAPVSGEVASVVGDGPLGAGNSIEVVLEYRLVSAPDAVVSARLYEPPGSGRVTTMEASPNRVYDPSGRVTKRLALRCAPDTPDRLTGLRLAYSLFAPGGDPVYAQGEQALPHAIVCRGTDDLRIVSLDPRTGTIRSWTSGETLHRDNSLEVVLEYELASAPDAVVSATLVAPGGAGRVSTAEESPNRVYDSEGRVRKRLALGCPPEAIGTVGDLRMRYWMYVPGAEPLVEKTEPLGVTVRCPGPVSPGAVARPDVKIPGRPVSPPAASRQVDVARPAACPDPAAVELDVRLEGRTARTRGFVELVGRVRNIGGEAFLSERGQQTLELVEEAPGAAPRVIETASFATLAPGVTTRILHRRHWDTAIEFKPRFRLRIAYEPDIRTDGNPRNDDCRLDNNEAVLEPARIDALFR